MQGIFRGAATDGSGGMRKALDSGAAWNDIRAAGPLSLECALGSCSCDRPAVVNREEEGKEGCEARDSEETGVSAAESAFPESPGDEVAGAFVFGDGRGARSRRRRGRSRPSSIAGLGASLGELQDVAWLAEANARVSRVLCSSSWARAEPVAGLAPGERFTERTGRPPASRSSSGTT